MGIVAVDLKSCRCMGLVGLGAKHSAKKTKEKERYDDRRKGFEIESGKC